MDIKERVSNLEDRLTLLENTLRENEGIFISDEEQKDWLKLTTDWIIDKATADFSKVANGEDAVYVGRNIVAFKNARHLKSVKKAFKFAAMKPMDNSKALKKLLGAEDRMLDVDKVRSRVREISVLQLGDSVFEQAYNTAYCEDAE